MPYVCRGWRVSVWLGEGGLIKAVCVHIQAWKFLIFLYIFNSIYFIYYINQIFLNAIFFLMICCNWCNNFPYDIIKIFLCHCHCHTHTHTHTHTHIYTHTHKHTQTNKHTHTHKHTLTSSALYQYVTMLHYHYRYYYKRKLKSLVIGVCIWICKYIFSFFIHVY